MPRAAIRWPVSRAVFLMALSALVHAVCCAAATAQKSKAPPDAAADKSAPKKQALVVTYGIASLPLPVIEMREVILAAVKSRRIEDIQVAVDMNEIKPAFSEGPVADPIAYLKAQSVDGAGQDVLSALGAILDAGYVAIPVGRDLENNRIFVWPYFAEVDLKSLTANQDWELRRIVPETAANDMREKGVYTFWRIGIAADGTWHSLTR